MKMRSETWSFLKYMQEQEFPVSAREVAKDIDMNDMSMKRRMDRLCAKDVLALCFEDKWVQHEKRRYLVRVYWLATHMDIKLQTMPHVQPTKRRRDKRIINSVFALGAMA
jgi:hypothetical protein